MTREEPYDGRLKGAGNGHKDEIGTMNRVVYTLETDLNWDEVCENVEYEGEYRGSCKRQGWCNLAFFFIGVMVGREEICSFTVEKSQHQKVNFPNTN